MSVDDFLYDMVICTRELLHREGYRSRTYTVSLMGFITGNILAVLGYHNLPADPAQVYVTDKFLKLLNKTKYEHR